MRVMREKGRKDQRIIMTAQACSLSRARALSLSLCVCVCVCVALPDAGCLVAIEGLLGFSFPFYPI